MGVCSEHAHPPAASRSCRDCPAELSMPKNRRDGERFMGGQRLIDALGKGRRDALAPVAMIFVEKLLRGDAAGRDTLVENIEVDRFVAAKATALAATKRSTSIFSTSVSRPAASPRKSFSTNIMATGARASRRPLPSASIRR